MRRILTLIAAFTLCSCASAGTPPASESPVPSDAPAPMVASPRSAITSLPSSIDTAPRTAAPPPVPTYSILDSARVTKKPFGVFITPQRSPVTPEKFRGYHTGADYEVRAEEDETKLQVPAICDGEVVVARRATGYGGVVVQRCTMGNEAVTVIYGHLSTDSFTVRVGDRVDAGNILGMLGRGYSTQTDGERPHLHLGIRRGSDISLLGYVGSEADLGAWMDPLKVQE